MYRAVVWFRPDGFKLNVKKTQHMVISLRAMPVDISVSSVKWLGVFEDNMWSWMSHVDYISGKISRVIRLLKKIKYSF